MEQIKNDQLTLEISSLGAELQSIKDANGNEYLWDGDEKYWNRQLSYPLPYRMRIVERHLSHRAARSITFLAMVSARDTEFKLVGKTADRLTFALIDNEETQKNYPYHFNLAISYRLAGQRDSRHLARREHRRQGNLLPDWRSPSIHGTWLQEGRES